VVHLVVFYSNHKLTIKMMMEKVTPKEQAPRVEKKKRSAEEAVQELEKRLAALGSSPPISDGAGMTENKGSDLLSVTNPTPPPVPAPPTMQSGEVKQVKGGKNALLALIMAAQEKAKEAKSIGPAASEVNTAGPPSSSQEAPPPAYDAGLLSPPPPRTQDVAPPPSFDAVEDNVMSQVQPPDYFAAAPPPPREATAVTPSAPAFEDLMGEQQSPLQPPQQVSPEEEMIMGMEGLSQEERRALLDEQRKIMEQIDREKNANKAAIAAAQADNFNMRSTSNAVNAIGGRTSRAQPKPSNAETGSRVNLGGGQEVDLHGPERTKEAIKDGTAVLVQCVNCENWMQVTGNATLMYCPVCAVVSPVDQNTAVMSKEDAMQMEADRKMAEKLQNEEYEQADEVDRTPRRDRQEAPATAGAESSWWDTMTGMFSTSTGDSTSAAQHSRSREERESLTSENRHPAGARSGARVAEQKPLFSCVVDSVNTTVGSLTGTQLNEDGEGNVHGVDASSLLAVSNVGRENPNN